VNLKVAEKHGVYSSLGSKPRRFDSGLFLFPSSSMML